MLKGCDISNYQGKPDFDIVRTAVSFVLCKATEGVGFTDPEFTNNQTQLRNFNILRGYYHFARPDLGNSPESEAEYFLKVVGLMQEGEILALDFEVHYTDMVNWCKKFLDHLSFLLGGYKPLIYLNLDTAKNADWSPVINENYGLWLADYDDNLEIVSNPWETVAFKQFSSTGKFPGIAGNVDLDVFYGDETAFKVYGYKPSLTPIQAETSIPHYDQDHINGMKALDDYRKVRLDGPEGNFEGLCRAIIDRDSKYTALTGQVSILQDQLGRATNTINDLTNNIPHIHNRFANFLYQWALKIG